MKNPTPNKISGPQKQTPSPAEPVKKEMAAPGSPQKVQSKSTKTSPVPPAPQKTNAPGSPQRKVSTSAAQPAKAKEPDSQKAVSPTPAQPDAAKPVESVTGKMFGFGSSIFSSASTLITSAVQDEPKSTPPVSPKMSAAKDSKSPTPKSPLPVKKLQEEKKTEEPEKAKGPPSVQPKADRPLSEPPKKTSASPVVSKAGRSTCPLCSPSVQPKADKPPAEPPKILSAVPVVSKAGQSTCPICELELNVGSKDPPNYNTCTECRNTVCNKCGFNPMPNVKEKTAVTNQVETKKEQIKSDASSKVETPVPDTLQKERATLGSPQKTRSTAGPPSSKDAKGPESERRPSPTPGEKKPLDIPVPSGPEKPTDRVSQPGQRQSKVTPKKQEESGNSIGLSGPKMVTDASKTTESISGKMFGFGSSIFSSASTLISSAVQEESRTTPPSSRKMSAPAQVSPKMSAVPKSSPKSTPTVSPKMSPAREPRTLPQKPVPEKKPDESHQSKDDKAPPQLSKVAKVSEMVPNAGQTTCPLCKAELNMGSKDPPNYNTCTECKNTVCNQCGFNPMPTGEVSTGLQDSL
uniref:Zinc finger piccolo-type domain-containing protein n=1 Tax=Amphilophus citrinellus TaxID=61819 RepID=A0A3Q0TC84_AMPCI